MIAYDLPEAVEVNGVRCPIRTDYRAILDILTALNDPELTDADRVSVTLGIFYSETIPDDTAAALQACMSFIAGGKEGKKQTGPRLVDWEKDFQWIVSPINRMLGKDIRGMAMHWWTFLSLYYEIGECTFSQIVRIRDAQARGRKLDKTDREWMRRNADLVYIEQKTTSAEREFLSLWTGGGSNGN